MMRVAVLVLLMTFAPVALAQETYSPPRTADSHPDLQGVWAARWLTPLERPAGVEKLVIGKEEAATLAQTLTAQRAAAGPLSPQALYPDASLLLVVRGEFRTSMIVDPATGKLPLTAAGTARRKLLLTFGVANPEERGVTERCLAGYWRAPILLGAEGMLVQVVQTQGHFVFLAENTNNLRIVEVGSNRRPIALVSWQGESIARWDGDTLVIETTAFRPDDLGRWAPFGSFPITSATRITERMTRVSDDEIVYRYTVDDAELYAQPWTAELSLTLTDDRMYETACHEGNYAMTNMLKGGRVAETRAAAKGRPEK